MKRRNSFGSCSVTFNSRTISVLVLGFVLATLLNASGVEAYFQDELEDKPEKLEQKKPRTETEQDKVDALSLFAEGRSLEQKEEPLAALRKYQRSFRYDPTSVSTLRELIPLAFSLKREQEAVRYAAKFALLDSSDPEMLRKLGVGLSEQGEWEKALAIYEKVLKSEDADEKSPVQVMLHMEMGRLYFLSSKLKKSAASFEKVLDALEKPSDYQLTKNQIKTLGGEKGEGYELLGSILLRAKKTDAAARAFKKLSDIQSNPANTGLHNAQIAAAEKKYDDALEELKAYFDAHETSAGVTAYELLAEILDGAKRSSELTPMLEKQHEAQPGNAVLSYSLAYQYQKEKKLDNAIAAYETALADRESAETFIGLVETLREKGDKEKLLKIFGKIIAKAETLEILLLNREELSSSGGLGLDFSKDGEKKETSTDEKSKKDSHKNRFGDPKANRELVEFALKKYEGKEREEGPILRACGLLALDAEEYKLAEDAFNRSIKAKPGDKSKVIESWGIELLQAKKYSEAATLFQRAIDEKVLPTSDPTFYYHLSGALTLAEKHDEAIDAAKTAASKKPNDLRYVFREPWILYHSKKYDKAADLYQELFNKFDESRENAADREMLRIARQQMSSIDVIRGKLPAAEEWLEQVLDEYPDDSGAMNDLGYLWADQNKRLGRAYEMIKKAIAEEPDNMAYLDSLGWILYRLGRYDEALTAQLKAVKLTEEKEVDGTLYDHLGDIYSKLDKKKEAVEAWQTAAKALEKSDEMRKLETVREKIKKAEK